jgi:hypothetical protein
VDISAADNRWLNSDRFIPRSFAAFDTLMEFSMMLSCPERNIP